MVVLSPMRQLDVGGRTSDYLFERRETSIMVMLPKAPTQNNEALSRDRGVFLPHTMPFLQTVVPGQAIYPGTYPHHHSMAVNLLSAARNHEIVVKGPQWPQASDFFDQCAELDVPHRLRRVKEPGRAFPSNRDHGLSPSGLKLDLVQRPESCQPKERSSTAAPSGAGGTAVSKDQRASSQFLCGLHDLIDDIRKSSSKFDSAPLSVQPNTHLQLSDTHIAQKFSRTTIDLTSQDLSTSKQPESQSQDSTQNAVDLTCENSRTTKTHTGGQNAQNTVDLTRGDSTLSKVPTAPDEQQRHLDALQAVMDARLALKEKEMLRGMLVRTPPPDTRQTASALAGHNRPQHHLGGLSKATILRIVPKITSEEGIRTALTLDHRPPASVPVSHKQQKGNLESLQAAKDARLLLMKSADEAVSSTSYLLESEKDGKIILDLNGMRTGCSTGRLLYRTGESYLEGLAKLGDLPVAPKVAGGAADFIITRSQVNYRIIAQTYHHLRARKEELVAKWKTQNPARAHLLSPHWWEEDVETWAPIPSSKVAPVVMVHDHTPHQGLELGEIKDAKQVSHRILFPRGLPNQPKITQCINVGAGPGLKKCKKLENALILPETEEVYERFARFVRSVKEQDWVVQTPKAPAAPTPQPTPQQAEKAGPSVVQNPKKRANEDAHKAGRPSKKVKRALAQLSIVPIQSIELNYG